MLQSVWDSKEIKIRFALTQFWEFWCWLVGRFFWNRNSKKVTCPLIFSLSGVARLLRIFLPSFFIKIKQITSLITPKFRHPKVRNFMRLWLPRESDYTAIMGDILFSLSFKSLDVVEYLSWQSFLDQSSIPNHHFQKVIESHQILYQMRVVLTDCVVKNLKTPWSEYHYTWVIAPVDVLAEYLICW